MFVLANDKDDRPFLEQLLEDRAFTDEQMRAVPASTAPRDLLEILGGAAEVLAEAERPFVAALIRRHGLVRLPGLRPDVGLLTRLRFGAAEVREALTCGWFPAATNLNHQLLVLVGRPHKPPGWATGHDILRLAPTLAELAAFRLAFDQHLRALR